MKLKTIYENTYRVYLRNSSTGEKIFIDCEANSTPQALAIIKKHEPTGWVVATAERIVKNRPVPAKANAAATPAAFGFFHSQKAEAEAKAAKRKEELEYYRGKLKDTPPVDPSLSRNHQAYTDARNGLIAGITELEKLDDNWSDTSVPNEVGTPAAATAKAATAKAKANAPATKAAKATGKLTRPQADGFLELVRNKLIEKCKGTLARLANSKAGGTDFYNRAKVNLREYVIQIVRTWAKFFKGMVTEATAHSLGTIYNALLSYSKELYKNYVAELNADPAPSDDLFGNEPFFVGVTPLEWLKSFSKKPNAKEWLKTNDLYGLLGATGKDGSYTIKPGDVKPLVNAIYAKLAAQQGRPKPKAGGGGAATSLSTLTCTHCSSVLRPAAPVPAGKKVRCPKCKETFIAGGRVTSYNESISLEVRMLKGGHIVDSINASTSW